MHIEGTGPVLFFFKCSIINNILLWLSKININNHFFIIIHSIPEVLLQGRAIIRVAHSYLIEF